MAEYFESVVASDVGFDFCPYNVMALLTIEVIMLISRYDARKMIGLADISILAICCIDDERLSKEKVRSTSSKNLTLSVEFPMRVKDIPSRLTVRAIIP